VVTGYRYSDFLLDVMQEWRGDRRLRDAGGCWVCAYGGDVDRLRCVRMSAARIDAHHVLPKQLLMREFPRGVVLEDGGWRAARAHETDVDAWRTLPALLMDARNGMPLRRYHHDALEAKQLVVPWRKLPAPAIEFAGELGLVPDLERRHPR
jgi:hypothetical protein